MKQLINIIFLLIMVLNASAQTDFLKQQKKYVRVRTAFTDKEAVFNANLSKHYIDLESMNILIVAFKAEDIFEIYAKDKSETSYKQIASYQVCSKSGELGPKRKQGDYQVPEGFYHIDRFNPASNYFLSLGINYPNAADRLKSKAKYLGGDIFIHGDCVTIGCLPMTDDKIKEIYLYAIHARNNVQKQIPVYIFPFKMSDQNFKVYSEKYTNNPSLIDFWTNLKVGYDLFVENKEELKISVDGAGDYSFN